MPRDFQNTPHPIREKWFECTKGEKHGSAMRNVMHSRNSIPSEASARTKHGVERSGTQEISRRKTVLA